MPLEVGGALRPRLEAEDSRLRLMASARQGGRGSEGTCQKAGWLIRKLVKEISYSQIAVYRLAFIIYDLTT